MWKKTQTHKRLALMGSRSFVTFCPRSSVSGWFTGSLVLGTSIAATLGSVQVFAEKTDKSKLIQQHAIAIPDVVQPEGNVWAWGHGFLFRPFLKENKMFFSSPQLLTYLLEHKGIKQLSLGEKCASFITKQGEFYVWTEGSEVPLKTKLKNIAKTACGREGIIAAVTDGGDVLLWDPRTKSKGGLVNLTDEPPVGEVVYNYRTITIDEVDPEAKEQGSSWWPWGPPKTKFVSAVCGSGHVALLDSKGRVYTLGVNTAGQLGTSKDVNTFHPDPTQIATLSGKNIVQIACGDKHTVALAEDGAVMYFGSDVYSSSTGPKPIAFVPVEIYNFSKRQQVDKYGKVVSITCGGEHTIVTTEKGAVFGWGNSHSGQVPIGRFSHSTEISRIRAAPFSQPGDEGYDPNVKVKQIECGSAHCAALTSKGDIYTFGNNYVGQCGFKKRGNLAVPKLLKSVQARKERIDSIVCAEDTTVVIEKA